MIRVSVFSITILIAFYIFSVMGRFLFPIGDEPDYVLRAFWLKFNQHQIYSPFYYLEGILASIDISTVCKSIFPPFSLIQSIDDTSCNDTLYNIFLRTLLTIILTSPLFFLLNWHYGSKSKKHEWEFVNKLRLSVRFSIITPGLIYYVGNFSEESFVLILALIAVYIYFFSRILSASILLFAIFFDSGNAILAIILLLNVFFYKFLYNQNKASFKKTMYFITAQIAICFFLGSTPFIIGLLSDLWIVGERSSNVYRQISALDLHDKYPLIFRPFITFMTFIFLTPAFLKVIPAYAYVAVIVVLVIRMLRRSLRKCLFNNRMLRESIILSYSSIAVILSTVFFFPNFVNAKYYIFLLPFILLPIVIVYSKKAIFYNIVFINMMVFLSLIIYRV